MTREDFGPAITGVHWWNHPLNANHMGDIPCPIDGCRGWMVSTGVLWPMGDPGHWYHCVECLFTAAIRESDLVKAGIPPPT